ncbi:hypothetical protein PQQ51_08245 [Paraburkholderia xenovorans]|uniref:hypothetical protein n=1 Tax=Paraburkholderia xenovorans TaxID=36873 RepID=UPI0038B7430D
MLRVRPGAVLTSIGWTFGTVDCGTEVDVLETFVLLGAVAVPEPLAGVAEPAVEPAPEELAGALLPPPPPQPVSAAQASSSAER